MKHKLKPWPNSIKAQTYLQLAKSFIIFRVQDFFYMYDDELEGQEDVLVDDSMAWTRSCSLEALLIPLLGFTNCMWNCLLMKCLKLEAMNFEIASQFLITSLCKLQIGTRFGATIL